MDQKMILKHLLSVKLPEGYKPSKEEEFMNENQRVYFYHLLKNQRQSLINLLESPSKKMGPTKLDNTDLTDRASLELDTNLNLETERRYKETLTQIDISIKKITEDEYGYCEDTGVPIDLERLLVIPTSTLSVEAQEVREKYKKTHASSADNI